MAKTFQEAVQTEVGGLHMRVIELTFVNEQLQEENAKLKSELEAKQTKDSKA